MQEASGLEYNCHIKAIGRQKFQKYGMAMNVFCRLCIDSIFYMKDR